MRILPFGDAFTIESVKHEDHRGHLAQCYDEQIFAVHGLNTQWKSQIQTVTRGCGVVRGMHWQAKPHEQIKVVRCVQGMVIDVIVDVRADSPNFGKYQTIELSGDDPKSLYIPAGFAHGFQCISEWCMIHYMLSDFYDRRTARSFYCEDPAVGIKWPLPVMKLSEQDASAPFLADVVHAAH